jgi:AraC-like DNA-binding protein
MRSVTVTACLLLAVLLLAAGRRRAASVPGAMLCLAIAAFFVTSAPASTAVLQGWSYPLTALCVTKAAWFWFFARALFNDAPRLVLRDFAMIGSIAVAGTWQQLVFLPAYRAGAATLPESVAGLGFEGVLLLLVLLGLREAWHGLPGDLLEPRRRLRLAFITTAGTYLAITLAVQSHNVLLDTSTATMIVRGNMIVVAAGCLVATWFLLQIRNESWIDPARTDMAVALTPLETAILANLQRALEVERIFMQEGLTIGTLAERLGTTEAVLRRVINSGMGHRNFNDFLHTWRVREACDELAKPELARVPVLSIAMKVGYGSVGAFNRAFKARVGMTPTAFRRNLANDPTPVR